jgi:hypothetical protein
MARRKTLQTNFSAGEISPELAMRLDTDQYAAGAKSLRNRRCLIGGGTVRRPGSWWQDDLLGPGILAEFIVNQTTQYILVFNVGRMDAYLRNIIDGTLTAAGSLTSCPWTGSIFQEMDWVQSGNTIFLVHEDMIPQKVVRTGASSWSRADFAFFVGPAARPEQPYLKIADSASRIIVSALTGSVTVTADLPVFVAAHVGAYIRYLGRAMHITAFTDTTHVTATVIETLPQTQQLTVTSSANFAVDEVVVGATTGAHGIITLIVDATHINVVLTPRLVPFGVETIVGPQANTAISAQITTTPAAVFDWDEQVFGPVYGYPSCVELHRNRLLFAGHPGAPDMLFASVINNLYNFNVGTGGDADAIAESIGDAGASKIVQLHSAEQLLVLTDRGPYYVPESATAPFRPSSIAFFPFGSPWPITATAHVQSFDGGVIFVSGSLVIKARPTGNLSAAWDADEISLLSPHIIKTPTRLTVTSNFNGKPERYSIFVNSDGTLGVMQLVEVQKIRNFTPWDTDGSYISLASIAGDLYAVSSRIINGAAVYVLELFDQDMTLDAVTQYLDETDLNDGSVATRYGSATVNVVTSNYHLGEYPVDIDPMPEGPFYVGFFYDSVVQTLPPNVDGPDGPAAGDFMRIVEAYVSVLSSAHFTANGYTLRAYQIFDDINVAPPLKNGPQRFGFMGWLREPTITINQPDPLPLEILAIRSTVAY